MKSATLILGSALLATAGLVPAFASEEGATRRATKDECRVAEIPAHSRNIERTVHEEPKRELRRVPRYETVTEPVYELRRVPVYEEREVPVYETVEVPAFKTVRKPVWGEKQVTVYREVRKPVTIELWNPFACENECLELWDKCEKVPAGTKTVPAIVAHEERTVSAGTRLERKQTGTRTERVLVRHRVERVQVGERSREVCVGHDETWVVVRPAEQRVETTCVPVASERVTLIPDGTQRTSPLAGTTRVMTESEYRNALAEARAR